MQWLNTKLFIESECSFACFVERANNWFNANPLPAYIAIAIVIAIALGTYAATLPREIGVDNNHSKPKNDEKVIKLGDDGEMLMETQTPEHV